MARPPSPSTSIASASRPPTSGTRATPPSPPSAGSGSPSHSRATVGVAPYNPASSSGVNTRPVRRSRKARQIRLRSLSLQLPAPPPDQGGADAQLPLQLKGADLALAQQPRHLLREHLGHPRHQRGALRAFCPAAKTDRDLLRQHV